MLIADVQIAIGIPSQSKGEIKLGRGGATIVVAGRAGAGDGRDRPGGIDLINFVLCVVGGVKTSFSIPNQSIDLSQIFCQGGHVAGGVYFPDRAIDAVAYIDIVVLIDCYSYGV